MSFTCVVVARGVVWQQRRLFSLPPKGIYILFSRQQVGFEIPASAGSRPISNSSLPERYVPKVGTEKVQKSIPIDNNSIKQPARVSETRVNSLYDKGSRHSRLEKQHPEGSAVDREAESGVRSTNEIGNLRKGGSSDEKSCAAGELENDLKGLRNPSRSNTQKISRAYYETPYESLFETDKPVQEQGRRRRVNAVSQDDLEQAARNYCISLLALGPQPEAKLREKMSRKKFSSQVMDNALSELQRYGLQSDREYSEAFARSRWNGNSWGPNRIKYELLRRGLKKEDVEASLMVVFQNVEEDDDASHGAEDIEDKKGDVQGRWGMTQEAAEQLLVQARRRWSPGIKIGATADVRKRRMAGWLQRRGFSWDVISDLLRTLELESQEETLILEDEDSV